MAEIHVQRRRPIWPWILGVLALAILIWAVASRRTEDGATRLAPKGPALAQLGQMDAPEPPSGLAAGSQTLQQVA